MSGDRSGYVSQANRLPAGENASTFNGHEHGASVSFFLSRNLPDTGPDLHKHPYEETFIIEDGNVRFTVGEETVEATAGDIVVVPARTPHKATVRRRVVTDCGYCKASRRRVSWI